MTIGCIHNVGDLSTDVLFPPYFLRLASRKIRKFLSSITEVVRNRL